MNSSKVMNQLDAYTAAKKSIRDLYDSNNGKKFIHHLIYSYINGDVRYILFSKKKIYDCLTYSELNTVYNSDRKCRDKEILDWLDKSKIEEDETVKSNYLDLINEKVTNILSTNPITRLSLRSTKSNKILGSEELQALIDFINEEVKNDNRLIISMVRFAKGELKPKKEFKEKKVDSRKTLGADDNLRSILESAVNG